MQPTSLLAYAEVISNLGEKQLIVLKCLDEISPATNMMIAEKLNWSINRITPRIYELRKKGLVKEEKVDNCPITNRKAIYWRFVKK